MPLFESRTDLPGSAEQVFDFIIRPATLQAAAPPEMQFVFVNPPEVIQLGSRLTCKAQAYGMIQQLSYEITEFRRSLLFQETMVEGPLKVWRHDYIIEPHASGESVTLIDRIEFEPPGGLLGFIVTADKIRDALEDGFDYTRTVLPKLFARSKS